LDCQILLRSRFYLDRSAKLAPQKGGRCEVHERFDADDIRQVREAWPNAEILAHPECPAEVLELVDFAGSTSAMSDYVVKRQPRQVVRLFLTQ
jgi:quinolinate synthase